ncbi:hypothetical protein [Bradyrhizobium sp. STM 3557]|uniref:hypothetical protein n=1 Tax=Bradyrhizobium sp. STM 3557 TaxID=578920 RepID=UPI00388F299E
MTDATTPPSIGAGQAGDVNAGNSDINAEIAQMQQAFEVATKTNLQITIVKTIEGSKETAAQQRPNIG